MKKVLTFGVFDYFHLGHLKLFEQAKESGDYLIVALQIDQAVKKYKPFANVFYSLEQRIHIVESLKIVDEVCTYSDVDKDIVNIDFDVFAVGEDQIHSGFQKAIEWCNSHGKQVVRLKYSKDISSTIIKGIKG